jgi:hypothetical protein
MTNSGKPNFKASDRVKRVYGEGCLGTVQELRAEVTLSSEPDKEVGYIVVVLWDNGTLSSFSPDGLKLVSA